MVKFGSWQPWICGGAAWGLDLVTGNPGNLEGLEPPAQAIAPCLILCIGRASPVGVEGGLVLLPHHGGLTHAQT